MNDKSYKVYLKKNYWDDYWFNYGTLLGLPLLIFGWIYSYIWINFCMTHNLRPTK